MKQKKKARKEKKNEESCWLDDNTRDNETFSPTEMKTPCAPRHGNRRQREDIKTKNSVMSLA